MHSITTVRQHLDSLNQGAHVMSFAMRTEGKFSAEEFLELMRHLHSAIETLANAVEVLEKKAIDRPRNLVPIAETHGIPQESAGAFRSA